MALWITAWGMCAGITFENPAVELKAKVEDSQKAIEFPFKNEGTKPFEILRIDSGCTCVKVELEGDKKVYAPGESGVLKGNFILGGEERRAGRSISLWYQWEGENEEQNALVTAKIDAPALFEIEPQTLTWTQGEANTAKRAVIHVVPDSYVVKLRKVHPPNENFTAALKVIEEGRKYELELTPKSTDAVMLDVFQIEVDTEIDRHRWLRVFGVVQQVVETPAGGE